LTECACIQQRAGVLVAGWALATRSSAASRPRMKVTCRFCQQAYRGDQGVAAMQLTVTSTQNPNRNKARYSGHHT
jgi:redox-regulated HSP33 family molecular chaperone